MTGKTSIFAAILLTGSLAAMPAVAADPTLHEVYQTAESGKISEALGMMDQVLRDHPNSAKAHFVEAELLAKQGNVQRAQSELATAEKLSPGLSFATPQSVQTLKSRLNGGAASSFGSTVSNAAPARAGGMPWGIIMLVIAAIGAVILFSRSRARPAGGMPATMGGQPGYGPGGAGQPGYGPGGGMMPGGGGMGSGIMGGLATGAALGAGMVAGEALAHKFTDGGEHPSRSHDANPASQPWDVGPGGAPDEQDFGVSDGSWDSGGGGGGGGDDWN